MDADELEDFQQLSNSHQPIVEGPLVGDKQSTTAIRDRFINADAEIYREKTQWLVVHYPEWRAIVGDGNCGWRATLFAFFETLLHLGSQSKCTNAIANLNSMESLLQKWGYSEIIYEDFRDTTLELLERISTWTLLPDAEAALTAAFNDAQTSQEVIQYFRFVVAAWMKEHAEVYEPYVVDVPTYCATHIEGHTIEIEEMGIQALYDAVIVRSDVAIKILYLDRSITENINSHTYEPRTIDGQPKFSKPITISVLYSLPGHFDIVYEAQDFLVENVQTEERGTPIHNTMLDDTHSVAQAVQLLNNAKLSSQPRNPTYGTVGLLDPFFSVPGTTYLTGKCALPLNLQPSFLGSTEVYDPGDLNFDRPNSGHPVQNWIGDSPLSTQSQSASTFVHENEAVADTNTQMDETQQARKYVFLRSEHNTVDILRERGLMHRPGSSTQNNAHRNADENTPASTKAKIHFIEENPAAQGKVKGKARQS